MRVNRNTYSKSRPVIKPADLNGASHVIVTITEVEEVDFGDDGKRLVLQFEEFPEHSYFPNVTSIDQLIAGLGEESDDWKGKQVPLQVVKTNNPTTKKATDALWVAPSDEWNGLFRAARRPSTRAPRKPVKAAKRVKARKR